MSDLELNLLNSDKIATELSKIKPENLKKILDSKLLNSNESNTEFDITIFNEADIFSTIDEEITKSRNRDLLSHPLVEAFLLAKWDTKIKKLAYFNTIGYFLFIINLTFLLYLVQFDIAGM